MSLLPHLNAELAKFDSAERISGHIAATQSLIARLETLEDLSQIDELTKQWEKDTRKNLKSSNSSINKLAKALDRVEPLIENCHLYKIPREMTPVIDNAIRLHLLREGDLGIDVGRSDLITQFGEKNRILECIMQGDLEPLIEWMSANAKRTELEFMTHRLQFLQYSSKGEVFKAYDYGKRWFPGMLQDETNLKDTAKLVASLIYPHNAPLWNESDLSELGILFSQQFCSHIGFSFESTLSTILLSAHIALPYFDKFQRIKALTQLDWSSTDELPFEVPLPEQLKFHAVYICPVTKCETTAENPAMSLPCHHVISKQAMWNLSKNGSSFKCPYCPVTALPTQCKEVQFHII